MFITMFSEKVGIAIALVEDSARYRQFCATTTASLTLPSKTAIPGGCNPAHPGSYPSSYFSTTKVASPTVPPTQPAGGNPSPRLVSGKTWSTENLTRYCVEDNSGYDYNFSIQTADKIEQCTVIRMPGSNAAAQSLSYQPCTTNSKFVISRGDYTNRGPTFIVITVDDDKELARFGVSDVNGQKVTPSNSFGSWSYGNLDNQRVYVY
ncbi:hypothetical protein SCAR479_13907 [Seiridium cardinale]|uniref:Uncharacterized protein n=1 Tax=Seiridium cardinale TaxID=138064 RepID=A0ABR2X6N9_9PEZI